MSAARSAAIVVRNSSHPVTGVPGERGDVAEEGQIFSYGKLPQDQ